MCVIKTTANIILFLPRSLSQTVVGLWLLPEDGVMGVATSPLTLNAAICCIWAAAMAAMGFR